VGTCSWAPHGRYAIHFIHAVLRKVPLNDHKEIFETLKEYRIDDWGMT
jgi:hypothetical protein